MAAAPPAATPQQAAPSPTNYLTRYKQMKDVFNGVYTPLFLPFATGNTQTPEELFETVVKSANTIPKVFLAQVSIDGARKIIALHRPSAYEPDLAAPAPQWNNKFFLFHGDIRPGSNFIQTYETPQSIFEPTDAQRVATTATMDAAWAADTTIELLPPLAASAANSESVVTRHLFPVPWKYVPLVLGKTLSPREAWTTLSVAINTDNNQAACAPLLAWLRVASTAKSRNVADPATFLGDIPTTFTPVVDDEPLDRHRWAVLTRDIPTLLAPVPTGATEQVATILGAMRNDRASERATDEARRMAEKGDKLPPATKYKTVAKDWMAFASVTSEANLPAVYHLLSNADKGEHLTILRNAVTLRARSAGAATNQVPAVSKETKVSSLPWTQFIHRTRGRSCIAPFISRLPHNAATILDEFRQAGVPVLSVDHEWTDGQRVMAATRGCHKSALEFQEFLYSDMADMVARGYWLVLPFQQVRGLPNLRISPIGCVP